MIQTKICGLSTPETLTAAIEGGADFIGLVFYPPSPRNVDLDVAKYLASFTPDLVEIVGLFVNPDDEVLSKTLSHVPLTIIQLHGDETPERVTEIKKKFNIPVMKAIGIETAEDLKSARAYDAVADWLLFDAKPAELPGGNGVAFDWKILNGYSGAKPWMLSGGLNPENVALAIQQTGAYAVDVSSGVESSSKDSKGVKDTNKIQAFLEAVKKA